jgi:hypothetical protein
MNKKEIDMDVQHKIISLYKHSKKGMAVIGAEYGISKTVVKRILLEHNIILDVPGQKYLGGKSASDKRHYQKHKEKRSANYKKWRKDNAEYFKQYHKQWRTGNENHLKTKREYEKNERLMTRYINWWPICELLSTPI